MTEEEKKYYEDVIYPEIARKDFEREIYKELDQEDSIHRQEEEMKASITLKNGDAIVTYVRPDKCPMPKELWEHVLGYCWGFATEQDKGKEKEFVKEHCPCGAVFQ